MCLCEKCITFPFLKLEYIHTTLGNRIKQHFFFFDKLPSVIPHFVNRCIFAGVKKNTTKKNVGEGEYFQWGVWRGAYLILFY